MRVVMQVMDNERCRKLPGYGPQKVHDKVICAADADKSTCRGDSGGGLTPATGTPNGRGHRQLGQGHVAPEMATRARTRESTDTWAGSSRPWRCRRRRPRCPDAGATAGRQCCRPAERSVAYCGLTLSPPDCAASSVAAAAAASAGAAAASAAAPSAAGAASAGAISAGGASAGADAAGSGAGAAASSFFAHAASSRAAAITALILIASFMSLPQ